MAGPPAGRRAGRSDRRRWRPRFQSETRPTQPRRSTCHAELARSIHGGTMALKLPRTIRLDPSDTFVYSRAAEPGEWAVTGTFLFFGADVDTLAGKERQAFRAGFLGIKSFGWSTLVVVTEATEKERADAVEALAGQLVAHCGAPGMDAARPA